MSPSDRLRVFIPVDGHRRFAESVLMPTGLFSSLREAKKHSYSLLIPVIQKIISHTIEHRMDHDLAFFIYSHGTQERDKEELDDAWGEVLKSLPPLKDQLCQAGIELKLVGDIEDIYYPGASKLLREVETETRSQSRTPGRRVELYVHYSGKKELQNDTHHTHFDGWEYDLVIRPGGEQRLSDGPLHLMTYSELVFQETLWPVYSGTDYDRAMEEFARRNRRFGK